MEAIFALQSPQLRVSKPREVSSYFHSILHNIHSHSNFHQQSRKFFLNSHIIHEPPWKSQLKSYYPRISMVLQPHQARADTGIRGRGTIKNIKIEHTRNRPTTPTTAKLQQARSIRIEVVAEVSCL